MVDNVAHYDGTACLEALRVALGRDGYISWLRGTIIKYQWRLGRKGNAAQDASKAAWYSQRLVEELERDEQAPAA